MVHINNFTTSPESFAKGNAKKITIRWEAFIESGDNPVDITLTAEDDRKIYFIDATSSQLQQVLLGSYDFTEEKKPYADATFIIVTESPAVGESDFANITMTALDKNGAISEQDFTITYK